MGNTFNTSTSTSEKIHIESFDKETGIKTSIMIEPEAYKVLEEYFKERALAENWHENSGLNKPAVSVSLPPDFKCCLVNEEIGCAFNGKKCHICTKAVESELRNYYAPFRQK